MLDPKIEIEYVSASQVKIKDATDYEGIRPTGLVYLFLTKRPTSGDVPVLVDNTFAATATEWTVTNLEDGYYRAELVFVPMWDWSTFPQNSIVSHLGQLYIVVAEESLGEPEPSNTTYAPYTATLASDLYKQGQNNIEHYGAHNFLKFQDTFAAVADSFHGLANEDETCGKRDLIEHTYLWGKLLQMQFCIGRSNFTGAQKILESMADDRN